jgi:YHS domain-containing protein
MTDQRTIDPTEDPVCGMTVDPDQARGNGLSLVHERTEFAFCGKGCLLEFRDDPPHYLDPAYTTSM